MRLNRFYTERKNIRVGSSVKLNDSDIIHIKKVLRLKKGDQLIVFNGETEYLATLTLVKSDAILVKLNKLLKENFLSNKIELTLLQGLLRAGKFDTIIEKATELGINNIVPIECDFSQSKLDTVAKKLERWNKLAVAASKQCERMDIPEVMPGLLFKDLTKILSEFNKVYFFTIKRENIAESLNAKNIKDIVIDSKDKKIAMLIGPEGGFSPQEHAMAQELGLEFVYLDSNVLRAETAAIFLTGLVQFIYS